MADRLSDIVTRTGDDGSTGLGDGSRVAKDSARIQALGDVDELNSVMGVLLAEPLPEPLPQWLSEVQHDLFDLGSELAVPGYQAISDSHVQALEGLVSFMNEELGPLREFILPGGLRSAALAHQARSVCRRAERAVVALAREEEPSQALRRYLNRLSDFLFVLARYLNRQGGVPDVLWQAGRQR
ncbi:cob(I)yrinic acid a,c-diamide adenosyltransferase [Chromobacterium subtsugae]|uniref:cob(I)yrinic acid a,c-diamide adenosyltransferase n=1 Tax=Chromobacterium subtsugae TaxID=251747 RepID=UPI000640BBE6|nr:cob(I)yrinic acid a,c-diamide adenosyltransferase [Chromobacterium subtsugae]OBU84419.1 ATP--cobalamin adenosyltransferase [Chromobacterium subtsugae]